MPWSACATHAANAGNAQGWRFVAVEDAGVRCDMAAAVDAAVDEVAAWPECEGREADIKAIRACATFFAGAPVVIAVFVLPYESRADALLELRGAPRERRDRLRQRPDLQSVGAAVQLLCTAAHAMGYGGLLDDGPGARRAGHRGAARRRGARSPGGGRPHRPPRRPAAQLAATARRRRPRVPLTGTAAPRVVLRARAGRRYTRAAARAASPPSYGGRQLTEGEP